MGASELPMDATLTTPSEIAGTLQGLSGFRRAGYRGPARSTADMQRAIERGMNARRGRGRY